MGRWAWGAGHGALGVRPDGTKGVLGLWIGQIVGAKLWLRAMSGLKTRGMKGVLIAVIDGLTMQQFGQRHRRDAWSRRLPR